MVRAMSLSSQQIADGLVAIAGSSAVIIDPARMAGYLNEPRKRFHQPAAAVVLPGTVEEVQAIARWANENRVALVPQGGNTGLVGAQVPLSGHEVIVSLSRLNKVRNIDARAGNMTVEAGLTLEEAHGAA